MCISIRQMMPCHILGLTHCVNILEEDTVEIMISAIVSAFTSHLFFLLPSPPLSSHVDHPLRGIEISCSIIPFNEIIRPVLYSDLL